MIKLKLWVGIILVFILGALAGSLGMGIYIDQRSGRLMFDDSRVGPPPPPMMHFLIRMLDKELELTRAQKDNIEKIMNSHFQNVHEIMQKQQPELEKLMKDSIKFIEEILGPEQREKFAKLKLFEKMKQRFGPKHPPRPDFMGGQDGFDELKERLVLSKAQEAEVQSIIGEAVEDRGQVMKKYEKLNHSNESKMEVELRSLQKNTETRLAPLLSEEQMETYKKMQKELPPFRGRHMGPHGPHGMMD